MAARRFTIEIEDVGGSFARMIREAPKVARAYLSHAVATTTVAVGQRMTALAPVDEGEMRDAIDWKLPRKDGLHGRAGIFDNPELVSRAMFNEYIPNKQPFMRPAAGDEASAFEKRARKALRDMEAALSRGL